MTDAMRRAQAGDDSAFEQLYREHVGRVYALCLRMSADAVAARELTQDVFVRAWERLDSFRGESAFASWLHRLAVPPAATRDGSPVLRLDLEAAVAALPPGARRVLVLHDIEGYEHAEIGKLLGIAEGTSKAHLFRARRLLREVLDR